MEKHWKLLTALGFLLAGFFVSSAAEAQNVDDKIKALEQELSSLKSQQLELKKESTAAAAALPSFNYRPGNGVDITAADQSWGLRFGIEAHLRALFESGQDAVGRTNGGHAAPVAPQYFLLHRQLSVRNRDDLGYGRFWDRQCQELDQHRHQFHPAARGYPLSPRELEPVPADG
jgi:hypothetical protein